MRKTLPLRCEEIERFKAKLIESGNQQAIDIFTVIFKTGLRLPQVLNIKLKDIDLQLSSVVVETKHNHKTQIIVDRECMGVFEKIIKTYPNDIFVFQSRNSNYQKNKMASPISRQTVIKAFKDTSDKCQIPITTQSLRQTYAFKLLKNSLDTQTPFDVSSTFHHQAVNMAEHYTAKNIGNNEGYFDHNNFFRTLNALQSINKNEDAETIYKNYNVSQKDIQTTIKTISSMLSK